MEMEERRRGREGILTTLGGCIILGLTKLGMSIVTLGSCLSAANMWRCTNVILVRTPGIRPIRRGVVGPSLMVEELGRRRVNHGDVYVIRFDSRLDEAKKGEVACATAGEVQKWMEAFDHAKQQVQRWTRTMDKLTVEDIDTFVQRR